MTKTDQSQRTTRTIVTFARSFRLDGHDDAFPAGDYTVETDEEMLQGVSFPAYRRTGTTMQRVGDSPQLHLQTIVIADPRQLDRALIADRAKIGPAATPDLFSGAGPSR